MIIALIAALFAAAGVIVSKEVLSRLKIEVKSFTQLLFLFLFFETLLLTPWFFKVESGAFTALGLVLFAGLIFVATSWNILFYRAMQKEPLYEFEIINSTQPLATVLLAVLFFKDERAIVPFLAAILAGLVLIWGHIRRHHLQIDRYSRYLLLAVVLIAVEALILKELLQWWSPQALYLFRTGFVFISLSLFHPGRISLINIKKAMAIALAAIFGVGQMVLMFRAYQLMGIVNTTLILLLSPVLVYLAAMVLFKEKMELRKILSALLILGTIVLSQVK